MASGGGFAKFRDGKLEGFAKFWDGKFGGFAKYPV